MNRRSFLRRALIAVPLMATPAALAELLVPRRTIFLPPRRGWLGDDAAYIEACIRDGYPVEAGRYWLGRTIKMLPGSILKVSAGADIAGLRPTVDVLEGYHARNDVNDGNGYCQQHWWIHGLKATGPGGFSLQSITLDAVLRLEGSNSAIDFGTPNPSPEWWGALDGLVGR